MLRVSRPCRVNVGVISSFEGVLRSWGINGRFLTQGLTGVQRYAREIVRGLDQHACREHPLSQDVALELLVPSDVDGEAIERLGLQNIAVRRVPGTGGHLWEQSALPRALNGGLISLCNTAPLAPSRQIVCIHDVNTRLCPESYSARFRLLYRVLLPAIGRRARFVTTVSQFSAQQLANFGISGPDKTVVVPNGHEHALAWVPRHSELTRACAGPDTIVLLGSLAPHKNIGLVLGLADRLAEAGLKIAVVGLRDDNVFAGNEVVSGTENITWLGRLGDEELAALLGECCCLAFPSLVEGFGLPPLEAMALGCPVVVSDRTSLPEVCADASLYASPDDPEAWLGQIKRLHNDNALRDAIIARGKRRASDFQWLASAERHLELMARVDRV